jgi:hypothetical protein
VALNTELERPATAHLAATVGTRAAMLAAGLTGVFVVLAAVSATEAWSGIETYARTFDTVQMAQLVPLIFLPPAVVVLMACVHQVAPHTEKLFGLIAIAFASVYAAIICTNYFLQLFVVRLNLEDGNLEGLALLAMPNSRSAFVALESVGYAFLSLAALFASQVFTRQGLEIWIRRLLVLSGLTGLLGAVAAPLQLAALILAGFGLSLLAFLVATVLLSIFFRRRAVNPLDT